MIQRQLKLRLTKAQERRFERWLWHLTGVYNWASRKVEMNRQLSTYDLQSLLRGHSVRMVIPAHVMRATAVTAHLSWRRYSKGLAGRPKLKSRRNRLASIPFDSADSVQVVSTSRVKLRGCEPIRFHKQDLPPGLVSSGRVVKRASGWYLCLFIHAESNAILVVGDGIVGIDPGFSTLLTLSTGEKIEHPRELYAGAQRLAQAQRGGRSKLVARLHERQWNRRRNRNHHISRRLIAENAVIVWSKDSTAGIQRIFGKSVAAAAHHQLRAMLAHKCRTGGRRYLEVSGRNSTRACSACGALSGPTGYAGLSVRVWVCTTCGVEHDRDVNAAVNTLKAGAGIALERTREGAPEIAA